MLRARSGLYATHGSIFLLLTQYPFKNTSVNMFYSKLQLLQTENGGFFGALLLGSLRTGGTTLSSAVWCLTEISSCMIYCSKVGPG
ncbi:hypothetical protein glysoja_042127 [Glycine soja]|uniref:Uncharacterized protein n=1 Tax=Glycine soja TaxID=3848 RepID=A0A0B2PEE5_GLYSO|nr:hypothetical protein glysoja_042127 [Glycine soja]